MYITSSLTGDLGVTRIVAYWTCFVTFNNKDDNTANFGPGDAIAINLNSLLVAIRQTHATETWLSHREI